MERRRPVVRTRGAGPPSRGGGWLEATIRQAQGVAEAATRAAAAVGVLANGRAGPESVSPPGAAGPPPSMGGLWVAGSLALDPIAAFRLRDACRAMGPLERATALNGEECIICMEQVRALPVPLAFRMDKRAKAMVKSAAVVSCCEQTFHMTCLCQWLEKGKEDHSSCPCCRAPIHHLLLANPPQAPAQALPSPEEALADAMSSPSEASFRIADAGELPSQEVDTADLHAPVDGEVEVDVEDPRPARRVVPNPLGRLGDPLTVGASGEVIADDGPESPVHIIDVGELQSALRHRDLAIPQRNPTCDEMLQRPLLGMQVGILVLALFGTIIYFMVGHKYVVRG